MAPLCGMPTIQYSAQSDRLSIFVTVELSYNVFFKLNDLHVYICACNMKKRCHYAVPGRTIRKKGTGIVANTVANIITALLTSREGKDRSFNKITANWVMAQFSIIFWMTYVSLLLMKSSGHSHLDHHCYDMACHEVMFDDAEKLGIGFLYWVYRPGEWQLQYYQPTRSLRSSGSHQLVKPRHNLSFGSRAFRISAPHIWNSLPTNIREAQSLLTFRRHLKTHYFQSAFSTA